MQAVGLNILRCLHCSRLCPDPTKCNYNSYFGCALTFAFNLRIPFDHSCSLAQSAVPLDFVSSGGYVRSNNSVAPQLYWLLTTSLNLLFKAMLFFTLHSTIKTSNNWLRTASDFVRCDLRWRVELSWAELSWSKTAFGFFSHRIWCDGQEIISVPTNH